MPKVLLWNKQTDNPESVEPADVRTKLDSGQYIEYKQGETSFQVADQRIPTALGASGGASVDKLLLGNPGDADPAAKAKAAAAAERQAAFSGVGDYVQAAREGVLQGLTFGLVEGESGYEGEARREERAGTVQMGKLLAEVGGVFIPGTGQYALAKAAAGAGKATGVALGAGRVAKTVGAGVEGAIFGLADETAHQLIDVAVHDKPFVAERMVSAAAIGGLLGAGIHGVFERAGSVVAKDAADRAAAKAAAENPALKGIADELKAAEVSHSQVKQAILPPEAATRVSETVKNASQAFDDAIRGHVQNLNLLKQFKEDAETIAALGASREGRFLKGLDEAWFSSKFEAADNAIEAGKKLAKWKLDKVTELDAKSFRAFTKDWLEYEASVAKLDDLLHLPPEISAVSSGPAASAAKEASKKEGTLASGPKGKAKAAGAPKEVAAAPKDVASAPKGSEGVPGAVTRPLPREAAPVAPSEVAGAPKGPEGAPKEVAAAPKGAAGAPKAEHPGTRPLTPRDPPKELPKLPTAEEIEAAVSRPFGLRDHLENWRNATIGRAPVAGKVRQVKGVDHLEPAAGPVERLGAELRTMADSLAEAGALPGGVPGVLAHAGLDGIRGKSAFIDGLADAWSVNQFAQGAAQEAKGRVSHLRSTLESGEPVLDAPRSRGSAKDEPSYGRRRAAELGRYAARKEVGGYEGYIMGQAAYGLIAGRIGRLVGWAMGKRVETASAVSSLLGGNRGKAVTRVVTAAKVSYSGDESQATTDPRAKGEQLRTMVSNEEALRERIRTNLMPIAKASPDLAMLMEDTQVNQMRNLALRAPAFLVVPGAVPKRPGPADNDFTQYEAVTHDPDLFIRSLKTASVTRPMVDAYREQHPAQYQHLVKELMGSLDEEKMRKLPLAVRKQVELVLGAPLFPRLGPRQQGHYAKDRQEVQQLPDGGPPNPRAVPRQSQGAQLMAPLVRPGQ